MKCLRCGYAWKRTKFREMVSFATTCPKCGSRWLLKGIFGGDLSFLDALFVWKKKPK